MVTKRFVYLTGEKITKKCTINAKETIQGNIYKKHEQL